jgi:hypothetical protein
MQSHTIADPKKNLLAEWIDGHEKSYIAHAVWGDNVAAVLQKGVLKSAEQLARERQTFSYEKGGMHGIRGAINLSPIIDRLKELGIRLPQCVGVGAVSYQSVMTRL